jgi:hypothetical protein
LSRPGAPAAYQIVPYRPELREQVVRLQRHLWSRTEALNAAYFEWKYERNPYVESPHVYLALHGREVVGMRGLFGARWEHGPPRTTFLGLCADDLVIAPGHRERGVFAQIMRAALDDLADRGHRYVFNLTASPVTLMASLASGWRSTRSLKLLCRSTPRRIDPRRFRGALRWVPWAWRYADRPRLLSSIDERHPFHWLDRNATRRRSEVSRRVSLADRPRAEAMAALVERIGHDGRIRHVRDREYFDWRFGNPLCEHRFLFWDEGRLEGYLVLQKSRSLDRDRLRCSIVDWEAGREEARADLLQAAIAWGRFPELVSWSATLPDEARRGLDAQGFVPLDEPGRFLRHRPSLLVRPTRDEELRGEWMIGPRRLLDLASWDLRMLYGM